MKLRGGTAELRIEKLAGGVDYRGMNEFVRCVTREKWKM